MQNVKRIYTGYVANPTNNGESFAYRPLYRGTQGNWCRWVAALWSEVSH